MHVKGFNEFVHFDPFLLQASEEGVKYVEETSEIVNCSILSNLNRASFLLSLSQILLLLLLLLLQFLSFGLLGLLRLCQI